MPRLSLPSSFSPARGRPVPAFATLRGERYGAVTGLPGMVATVRTDPLPGRLGDRAHPVSSCGLSPERENISGLGEEEGERLGDLAHAVGLAQDAVHARGEGARLEAGAAVPARDHDRKRRIQL